MALVPARFSYFFNRVLIITRIRATCRKRINFAIREMERKFLPSGILRFNDPTCVLKKIVFDFFKLLHRLLRRIACS